MIIPRVDWLRVLGIAVLTVAMWLVGYWLFFVGLLWNWCLIDDCSPERSGWLGPLVRGTDRGRCRNRTACVAARQQEALAPRVRVIGQPCQRSSIADHCGAVSATGLDTRGARTISARSKRSSPSRSASVTGRSVTSSSKATR